MTFWACFSSFLQCKKGIFYKMVARRGKCPKHHFLCNFGLLSYRYKIYQVGLEFRKLFDILVHPTEHGPYHGVGMRMVVVLSHGDHCDGVHHHQNCQDLPWGMGWGYPEHHWRESPEVLHRHKHLFKGIFFFRRFFFLRFYILPNLVPMANCKPGLQEYNPHRFRSPPPSREARQRRIHCGRREWFRVDTPAKAKRHIDSNMIMWCTKILGWCLRYRDRGFW